MRKFTLLEKRKIKTQKKYQDSIKNKIYSIIKENLNINIMPLNEDISHSDIDINGLNIIVEKLDSLIKLSQIQERIKVLKTIKFDISTGILDIKRINEEIESSEYMCSELNPEIKTSEDEEEIEDDNDGDFNLYNKNDKNDNDDIEFVTTMEKLNITGDSVIDNDLIDDFIKISESNNSDMTWNEFFERNNINQEFWTERSSSIILNEVKKRRPDILN
jgi:hypothetical protein